MAYNNVYPISYQQANPQFPTYQPQQSAPAQSGSGLTWVSGEAGAKSYLVAPNSAVPLWDSESQTIYLKSADASGMPTIKTLRYTIDEASAPAPNVIPKESYASKEELDALRQEIKSIRKDVRKYMIREVDDAD